MDRERLTKTLEAVRAGALAVDAALRLLEKLPYEDLGDLRLDHHRQLRTGAAEAIFGEGKTADQIHRAVEGLAQTGVTVLVTRVDPEVGAALAARWTGGRWHARARVFHLSGAASHEGLGRVVVVCAGTTDLPVAEEALVTAQANGAAVELIPDVGIAGLHRLLAVRETLAAADVVIVVAGMEGALPSAVGGLVSGAVIAVPTSVGYGAAFGGIAALLGMLTSCAPGVVVCNIDNGYGAGVAAARIVRRLHARATNAPEPDVEST